MRQIDADDFGNRMYHEAFENDTDLRKWDSGCWIRYKLFENVLREQPTVENRKKGRWLRYGEDGYPNNEDTVFWQCDQCLEQYTGRTKRIPNFCPNCGAKMKGEQNE